MRNDDPVRITVDGKAAERVRQLAEQEYRTINNVGQLLVLEALRQRAHVRQPEKAA